MNKSASSRCSECGTQLADSRKDCWLCQETRKARRRHPTTRLVSWCQFDLATAFLTMSLIGLCLGLARLEPTLGIALAVLSGPAYIRTCLLLASRTSPNPANVAQRVYLFIDSVFLVIAIMLYGSIALISTLAICFTFALGIAIAVGNPGEIAVGVLTLILGLFGIAASGAGLYRMLQMLWPDYNSEKPPGVERKPVLNDPNTT